MPEYVVSSTLEEPDWNNSTVLKSDAVDEVSKLKQELNGEIVVVASFQPQGELLGPLGIVVQVLGRGEGAGQAQGDRVGVGVHDAAHKPGEGGPGVAVVGQGRLRFGEVAAQAVAAEAPQQLLFAGVAAVEGTHAHAGLVGHRGDGRAGVGDEHCASGLQDCLVVVGRLGPPAAQRHVATHT